MNSNIKILIHGKEVTPRRSKKRRGQSSCLEEWGRRNEDSQFSSKSSSSTVCFSYCMFDSDKNQRERKKGKEKYGQ